MEILERLQNILRELLDDETIVITPETKPEDIDGWDSLFQISIISEVQEEFDIEFEISEIMEMASIGAIIKTIAKKTGEKGD